MICQKCGTELEEGSTYCNKCGEKQVIDIPDSQIIEFHSKNKLISFLFASRKNRIIASSLGMVVIAILILVTLQITNPVNQFINNLNSDNYKQAMIIYNNKIKGNSKSQNQMKKVLINNAQDIYIGYKTGKIDFTEASKKLNRIKETNLIDSEVSSMISDTNNLEKSHTAFKEGVKFIGLKDYKSAIIQFEKVIPDDNNYAKSTNFLQTAINQWVDELKVKKSNLKNLDEMKSQIDSISEVIMATGKNDNIAKIQDAFKEKYSSLILVQANLLVKQNDFLGAIELLNQNKNYEYKSNLSERIANIQNNEMKVFNANKFNQLKSQFTIQYDKIDNMYIIVPKGYDTKYNNLTNSINIEPRITVTGDIMDYMLISGFVQNDWIFMNRITFANGDKRHEYEISSSDRQTQVLSGTGIAEWYAMVDDSDSSLNGLVPYAVDLTGLIGDISKTNNNQIRFSGNSQRDHTLTASEKNNIINLWAFYKLLKSDNTLIKSLA